MKSFFRTLSAVLLAFCVPVFSSVAYGSVNLPDEVSVTGNEPPDFGLLYSASDNRKTVAAATNEKSDGEYTSQITALKIFPVKDIKVSVTKRRYVGIGGDIFGIKLYTKGVIVAGVDSVTTSAGSSDPAGTAGIKCGDVITHIDGSEIESAQQLNDAIESCNGEALQLKVDRSGESVELSLKPQKSVNGKYKAGLWVRDSSAGIGTITFYDDKAGIFAGLGHGVCDVDTGKIMPLSDGEAVKAKVNGFYKSSAGHPGELCGVFSSVTLGKLLYNGDSGVYGEMNQPSNAKLMPVALEGEVKTGKAQMIATIDENGPQYYDIEITKLYSSEGYATRNMIIKVTDPELLEKTGGILQGFSGSPIIQNSMLVGAVTHVFINDTVQGYGIFAETMLKTADGLRHGKADMAA